MNLADLSPLIASFAGSAVPIGLFLFKAGADRASLQIAIQNVKIELDKMVDKVEELVSERTSIRLIDQRVERLEEDFRDLRRKISPGESPAVRHYK